MHFERGLLANSTTGRGGRPNMESEGESLPRIDIEALGMVQGYRRVHRIQRLDTVAPLLKASKQVQNKKRLSHLMSTTQIETTSW